MMAAACLLNGRHASHAVAQRAAGQRGLPLAARPARSTSVLRSRNICALPGLRPVQQQHRLRSTRLAARRAEYDDDEDWDDGPGLGMVPGILGGALGAIGTITDFVARNLPASVSRGVVDISVKAGLALVVLGFARSLLSLVTTIGTIVFGLWLASKVMGGGDNGKSAFSFGGQRDRSGQRQRRQQRRPRLSLPGSDTSGDLADVWFERQDEPRKGRRQ